MDLIMDLYLVHPCATDSMVPLRDGSHPTQPGFHGLHGLDWTQWMLLSGWLELRRS